MTEESQRAREARIANMRQEILAPIHSIVEIAEGILEKAEQLELSDAVASCNRIISSAQRLLESAERLLDDKLSSDYFAGEQIEFAQDVLGDALRNPISILKTHVLTHIDNVVKYKSKPLNSELMQLLGSVEYLLSQLYTVVADSDAPETAEMVEKLAQEIQS